MQLILPSKGDNQFYPYFLLKIIAFMNIVNLGVAMNFTGAKE
jgi:hypothetical protein